MKPPRLLRPAWLGLLAAAAIQARAEAPDPRIRSVDYAADAVLRIAGREGFQSSIVFGDDEKIENVAVGDSLGWQVTPNKRGNLLFLKPMPRSTATNMTVVTDKRVYLFDLAPAAKARPALYSLRFNRVAPAAPPAEAVPAAPAAAPPAPPPEPQPAVAQAPAPRAAALHFAWRQEGARQLLPAHVFDDGRSVFLDWRPDAPLPAILSAGPDGVEGPVNYTVQGRTLVVDGPATRLVLRVGRDAAVLTRLDADPAPAGTAPAGTASAGTASAALDARLFGGP
ncbi:TrbG/VirB9 family P-type conjugative transfer protein [Pseudorhodoferax sp.]|uniref:TrbG/VirB9 family P-type conjugative transfer protein n=1 Tax=Pseudorhodoferax sp. TaxID=1993553 RepID=UPI0039E4F256